MASVARDWRTARLLPTDRLLGEFAANLTRTPLAMAAADVEVLRAAGFTDVAIHDTVQVVAYFAYINRVSEALGVEHETFVRAWEQVDC